MQRTDVGGLISFQGELLKAMIALATLQNGTPVSLLNMETNCEISSLKGKLLRGDV